MAASTRAEGLPCDADLVELARSIGSSSTSMHALAWARSGIDVWRRDLCRGIVPGSVRDAQTVAAASAPSRDTDALRDTDELEIWPGHPLLETFQSLAASLALPALCARHATLADAVLRSLIRLSGDYQEAVRESGLSEAGGTGTGAGAASRERADAAVAEEIGARLREQWAPAASSIGLLDQVLDGRLPPGLLPTSAGDDSAGGPASEPQPPGGEGALAGAPESPASGAPLGHNDGLWRESGWAALAKLQRRVEGLPELRAFFAEVGRRAAPEGSRRGRLPRLVSAAPPAVDGVTLAAGWAPPAELGGVRASADFARALPAERILLRSGRAGRALFRAKLAEGSLATLSLDGWSTAPARPPRARAPGAPIRRERTPLRDGGGPLLICLDTSGSMDGGAREALSKACVLAAARVGAREARPVRVIAFGSARDVADSGDLLGGAEGVRALLRLLECSFSGGTDVVGALRVALAILEDDDAGEPGKEPRLGGFARAAAAAATDERQRIARRSQPPQRHGGSSRIAPADLILVTDGELPDPPADKQTASRLARLREGRGVRVHCLLVCSSAEAPARAARMRQLCGDGGDGGGVRDLLCVETERFYSGSSSSSSSAESRLQGAAQTAGAVLAGTAKGTAAFGRRAGAAGAQQPALDRLRALRGGHRRQLTIHGRPCAPHSRTACQVARVRAIGHEGGESDAAAAESECDRTALAWLGASRPALARARDWIASGLHERDAEAALLLLAGIAGEHVLMIGPPGTGKSLLARRLSRALGGARFEALLSKFTPPEELFGPLSLRALEEDQYARITDGYLPSATVAFLDEIFKANAAILNSLLGILNERLFHGAVAAEKSADRGSEAGKGKPEHAEDTDETEDDEDARGTVPVPLVTCVGSSNELPESEELGALYDRFLIRLAISPLSDDGLLALLRTRPQASASSASASPARTPLLATADAGAVRQNRAVVAAVRQVLGLKRRAAATGSGRAGAQLEERGRGAGAPRALSLERAVALPHHVGLLLLEARAYCEAEWGANARPSDRRLAQSARLLRISAATNGRAVVGSLDCLLLAYTLCPEPALAPDLQRFVRARCTPRVQSGTLRLVLAGVVSAASEALRQTGGELLEARGVSRALAARLAALATDVVALRAAVDADSLELEACALELGLGGVEAGPSAAEPAHLWVSQAELAAAVQELRPVVRAQVAALAQVRELVAHAERMLCPAPPSALPLGATSEEGAAVQLARDARERLEASLSLVGALDDGGGSAAGRALRAASAGASSAFNGAGAAELRSGDLGDDEDSAGAGAEPAVAFSDDELRMGLKEAKAALRSPSLFRAWKRAKRAAAAMPAER